LAYYHHLTIISIITTIIIIIINIFVNITINIIITVIIIITWRSVAEQTPDPLKEKPPHSCKKENSEKK
jgi:hypothetical protein